jgi:hypothetical protein
MVYPAPNGSDASVVHFVAGKVLTVGTASQIAANT